MGNTARLPAECARLRDPACADFALSGPLCRRLAGRPARASLCMFGWEDDRARCQLFRADVASQLGDGLGAKQSLDAATGWILHSGSVEHLCVYHLVRARSHSEPRTLGRLSSRWTRVYVCGARAASGFITWNYSRYSARAFPG